MDAVRVPATRPVVDITMQHAKLHITNSFPRVRIRAERPMMKVHREAVSFKISRSEVRRQVNRQLNASGKEKVTPEHRARAEQRVLKALSRLSADSSTGEVQSNNALSAIVAEAVSAEAPQKASIKDLEPQQSAPSIEWDTGHLSIEWSDCVLEIEWDDMEGPQIDVEPYSIEVNIRNQPIVRFKMNPKKMPDSIGANIDAKI